MVNRYPYRYSPSKKISGKKEFFGNRASFVTLEAREITKDIKSLFSHAMSRNSDGSVQIRLKNDADRKAFEFCQGLFV